GGQGTRLRFAGPKGMFPIGPVTGRTLFQLHAEKILAWARRLRKRLTWIIMTSDANDAATRDYFARNAFFGHDPADVFFAQQGMFPVVDPHDGKILLESKSRILLGPDGHGGAFKVLCTLRPMLAERGIEHLFYFQVDNPLVRILDPAMIGYHVLRESQFTSKAVAKSHPGEKVGVFCNGPDGLSVVEYTELGEEERTARDPSGALRFRAGNIAIHVLSCSLLDGSARGGLLDLPVHVARKATPHFQDGRAVDSTEPNSFKFETFIFDALPLAKNPLVLETLRGDEFAPVKNLEGADSPATAKTALSDLYAEWLAEAGVDVPRDAAGHAQARIEISPLFADGPDVLAESLAGKRIAVSDPLVLA
ncbi:MAG: UTP--glucose-1-phosphate uridylyltransferase, partial [Planctomycetes bacterium]|nr:UTP--glucose-1-phosphate uridylyltransferase [Planctomycetota bacterium]